MIKLFSSNRFPPFWPPSAPGAACPFSLTRKILCDVQKNDFFISIYCWQNRFLGGLAAGRGMARAQTQSSTPQKNKQPFSDRLLVFGVLDLLWIV